MGNPVSPADAGTVAGGRVTGTNGTLPCTQAWLAGLRLCGCAERVPLSAPPPTCSAVFRGLGDRVSEDSWEQSGTPATDLRSPSVLGGWVPDP